MTMVMITSDLAEPNLLADRIIPLNPDGTLGQVSGVSRPRDGAAMNHDAGFKRLRAEVTEDLMDVGIAAEVDGARRLPNGTPRSAQGSAKRAGGADLGADPL